MSNISVAEILKIHGQWIGSKEFIPLVSQKLKITDRHTYNLIKKASDTDKSIIKITLDNRKVIYGLPEFGPNESLPIANIKKGQRLGFFEWLKWKREEAGRERAQTLQSIEELRCDAQIKMEMIQLNPTEYTQDKAYEIEKKWRVRYGLDKSTE